MTRLGRLAPPQRPCLRSSYISQILLLAVTLLACFSSPVAAVDRAKQYQVGGEAIAPLKSHGLYSPYVESNLQNKHWDFGGDAIVDTNRHIRLTQDRPHQSGYVWSRAPLPGKSFEITWEFRVDGKGSAGADGMAMWLTQGRAEKGPVFGSKDYFDGLGIFFDTYANARHPYGFPRVMAMLNQGTESYRIDKDGANQELAGCSMDFRRTSVSSKAKLTVVEGVYLELQLHVKEWDQWESCFKIENVKLPNDLYVGFTALTGDVSDNHDLVSVSTSRIVTKQRSALELEAERRKHFPVDVKTGKKTTKIEGSQKDGAGSSIRGFFHGLYRTILFLIKWGIIVAVIAGAVILGLRYKKQHDVKRF